MPKLLIILPRSETEDNEFNNILEQLLQFFIEQYKTIRPHSEVERLYLYDMVPPFINFKMALDFVNSPDDSTCPCKKWVQQFKSFDQYLMISPTYNFGMLGIVKTYIDLLAVNGETFMVNEQKQRVGLLGDKKMMIITTNDPSIQYISHEDPAINMNYPYLKQFFQSLGIPNITHFQIDKPLLSLEDQTALLSYIFIIKQNMKTFIEKL